jgi:hypothetical protein
MPQMKSYHMVMCTLQEAVPVVVMKVVNATVTIAKMTIVRAMAKVVAAAVVANP